MWSIPILLLLGIGFISGFRIKALGVLILSLGAIAATGMFGWLLSYSPLSLSMLAFGGLVAVQVGFFLALLAQIRVFGWRSAEHNQWAFLPDKADEHTLSI